jgi:murein DD-endopeptidase MepM/ murein hydrolase activator NlpD
LVLRWLATSVLLSIPALQGPVIPPELKPLPPPLSFDRSLESLERNRVITPLERRQLETGQPSRPIDVPAFQQACRSGALSKQECSSGVAVSRRGSRLQPRVVWKGRDDTLTGLSRRGLDGSSLPPISVPVKALLAGSTAAFRLEKVFAVSPRPAPISGNGDRRLLFPIIGSAITTSEFGWRIHPIIGRWLMHAGKDLAAPEGTPVVAALSGTVLSSGLAGGYGVAVELAHDQPKRRTLYGHLSEIYVKSGQKVRQGEVIGRVGSTGLSTGPHLHFELRRPEAGGWVAVDPGDLDLNPLTASGADAVSLLVGQLMTSLERSQDS